MILITKDAEQVDARTVGQRRVWGSMIAASGGGEFKMRIKSSVNKLYLKP